MGSGSLAEELCSRSNRHLAARTTITTSTMNITKNTMDMTSMRMEVSITDVIVVTVIVGVIKKH
jgi:hypothetical protein